MTTTSLIQAQGQPQSWPESLPNAPSSQTGALRRLSGGNQAFHMMSRLLTASEVARWLNVSRGWVFDHASGRRKPLLPSIKLGKAIRFEQEAVTAWIEALSKRDA